MLKYLMRRFLLTASLALICAPAVAEPTKTDAFNAAAAWTEFTDLLRTEYGYLHGPGVDGDAILAAFQDRAVNTTTPDAFIDVLQLVAHNFADPHFIVGPLNDADYDVFPTNSDMVGRYEGGLPTIVDTRTGGDAQARGVPVGATILTIDGLPPPAAIELVMGRPVGDLSERQRNAALNIALAGKRKQRRALATRTAAGRTRFDLAPARDATVERAKHPVLAVRQVSDVTVLRLNNSLGDNTLIDHFRAAVADARGAGAIVVDLRNTPSGGNTTVARAIMGHFVTEPRPYQMHVVPSEQRRFGVERRFVEYVMPREPHFAGKVVVLGGHWTGSMGEGLMVGFDALGIPTAGSDLADLLGGLHNEDLTLSGARLDIGEEQLFHVDGTPREAFRPKLFFAREEADGDDDPLLDAAIRSLSAP